MIGTLRRRVDRVLEALLALLLGGMVLNVLWQVFARFVLADPSSVTEELARFGLVWLGLLGAAHGFGRRVHLAIDLLPMRLAGRPGAAALRGVIQACVAGFALVVLVGGGGALVHLTWSLGQTSAALGVRLAWVYSVLPLAGAIILFHAVAEAIEPEPQPESQPLEPQPPEPQPGSDEER